ncbi:MAG: hypothetical protein CR967_01845 [Proteobacteria bacterium]|nr:MAG: hypothetical protein CR967_01845 [Pseudomonadota bacterium]
MKKVLLFLFATTLTYALSLVEIYRGGGIDSVEIEIEKMLQSPSYWQEYLKDKDVDRGFYEFDTPIVFIDKTNQTMKLVYNVDKIQVKKSYQNIITGKMGDKQVEGDLKTPVGVYDIVKRFVPENTFYGPIAFSLSYPNTLDKLDGKNGHGIWIHGFPLDESQRGTKTKGCVALENDILVKFDKDLGVDYAVVIISENGENIASKGDISNILANLYQWRYAWALSDVDAYLNFYDGSFKRFDGKNKQQFARMKKIIFKRKETKIIRFKNIAISPYPNMDGKNMYRVVFDEYYRTKNYKFDGKKELYILLENDKMRIIAEK